MPAWMNAKINIALAVLQWGGVIRSGKPAQGEADEGVEPREMTNQEDACYNEACVFLTKVLVGDLDKVVDQPPQATATMNARPEQPAVGDDVSATRIKAAIAEVMRENAGL